MPRQLSPIINKALTTTVDTLFKGLPESSDIPRSVIGLAVWIKRGRIRATSGVHMNILKKPEAARSHNSPGDQGIFTFIYNSHKQ